MECSAYKVVFYLIIRGIQQKLDNPENYDFMSYSKVKGKEAIGFSDLLNYKSFQKGYFVSETFKACELKYESEKIFFKNFSYKEKGSDSYLLIDVNLLLKTEEQKIAFSEISNIYYTPIHLQEDCFDLASNA